MPYITVGKENSADIDIYYKDSDGASFTTGQIFPVDGDYTAQ